MKTIEELNRTAREFEKSEADSAIKLRQEAHQRKTIKGLKAKVEELEAENRWIPVSERLPEVGQEVLLCNKENVVMLLSKWTKWCEKGLNSTHWKPIILPDQALQVRKARWQKNEFCTNSK